MLCKLYINNELYRTIESKNRNSYLGEIQWAVHHACPPSRVRQLRPNLADDEFRTIIFRHCGFGFYHVHVKEKLEQAIRKLDKYPQS